MLQIPSKQAEAKIEIKNSRFIGRIFHVASEEAALTKLNEVKHDFSNATHNCWAYRIDLDGQTAYRFNDEGEPGGTAGKPILESLTEKDVVDALLVVTRYYGGIKLGMGGLSRAYRACARETIEKSGLVQKVFTVKMQMTFNYPLETKLRNLLEQCSGAIIDQQYSDRVMWNIEIADRHIEEFRKEARNLCAGEIDMNTIENIK